MAFQAGAIVAKLTLDRKQFSQAITKAKGDVKKFGSFVEKNSAKFKRYGRSATMFGMAVVGGIGIATKAFGDFDKAMTESVAIMGDVSDDMRTRMEDTAKQMSEKSTFAAKELGEAYYFLASAGMDAEQSISALPKVTKFAQAGAFDLATATDLLTDAQTAMGLSAKDAAENEKNLARVSDVLVGANTLANASVQQFSEALTNRAAAALTNVNKDLEEGVAILAAFADKGVKGQKAGMRLSMMLNALDDAYSKGKDAWKEYNIQLYDASGAMVPMADLIGQLEERFKDMSVEQKSAALAQLGFNTRTKASILTLMGSSEKIRQWNGELKEMGGITDEVAGKQLETFNNQMKLVKNELVNAAAEIGKTFAPAIKTLAGLVADVAKALAKLPAWLQKTVGLIGALAAVLGPVAMVLPNVVKGFGMMASISKKLLVVIPKLGVALKLMLGPLGLIAVAAGTAYVGLKKLIKAQEEATDAAYEAEMAQHRLGQKLREAADEAGLSRKEYIQLERTYNGNTAAMAMAIKKGKEGKKLQEALAKVGKKHREEIEGKAKAIKDKEIPALEDYTDALNDNAGANQSLAEELGLVLKVNLENKLSKMEMALKKYGDALPESETKRLKEEIHKLKLELGLINPVTDTAIGKSRDLGFVFQGEAIPAARDLGNVLDQVPEKFEKVAYSSGQAGQSIVKNLGDALSGVGDSLNILGDMIGGASGELVSQFGGLAENIGRNWESIYKDGKVNFDKLAGAATQMAGSIGGTIGSLISGTKKNFAAMGSSLGKTIGKAVGGPIGAAVGGLLGGIVGGLFKKGKTEAEKFEESVDDVKDSMSEFGDISEGTAEAIAKSKKEMSDHAAKSKHFSDVIEDVGVNQENINDLWGRATEILDDIESGELEAGEGAEELGKSFSKLADEAERMGTEGSAAMVDFINQVKASGVEVAEVTDYINNQLGVVSGSSMNAAQGLEAMAQSVGNNEKAMGRLETQTLAVYNAMIENGATASQAMDSLGGTLDAIAKKHKENGTQASASMQKLLEIRKVTEANKGLFSAMEGNLAVLNALGNTGSLTQETLNASAQSAQDFYGQLQNAGLSGKEALAQIAPTLERLRYLSKEQGLELDENTQKMIEQAEAQGVLEEQQMETNDIMLAGFGEIIKALGGDIPDAMQTAMNKMSEFGQEGQETASNITGSFSETTQTISSEFTGMGEHIKKEDDNIERYTRERFEQMGLNTKGISDKMAVDFSETTQTISAKYVEMGDKIRKEDVDIEKKSKEVFDKIKLNGKTATDGMAQGFENLKSKADERFKEMARVTGQSVENIKGKFLDMKNAGTKQLGELGQEAKKRMMGMADDMGLAADKMKGALSGLNFSGGGGSVGAEPIAAQEGGAWEVKAEAQPFIAHKGERVDVTPVNARPASDAGGQGVFVIEGKPVVIEKDDKYIVRYVAGEIKNLKRSIAKGRVPVPMESVRSLT